MNDAYILSACRTPIGKFRGALAAVPSPELGAAVVRAAVERSSVPPDGIDEAIMGCVLPAGLGQAPARQAALGGGLPPTVAALTINKVCGSGLKAVMLAAQAVRCGDADAVVAGGMESMSRAPLVLDRDGPPLGNRTLVDTMQHDGLTCALCRLPMGDIADDTARRARVSRADQDRFALASHLHAAEAQRTGAFAAETVPVTVVGRRGDTVVEQDEGPRADSSIEQLAGLRTVFSAEGTVTAGNASMISDGAAAVVVASRQASERHGSRPLARIVSQVTVGGPPEDLFLAPIEAVRKVVAAADLALDDIDLYELNEAFAAQAVACLKELAIPEGKVNVNGGAVALGHPIGASGARVLVTLLHALKARGLRRGVAALCLGGGNAVAMLVDRQTD